MVLGYKSKGFHGLVVGVVGGGGVLVTLQDDDEVFRLTSFYSEKEAPNFIDPHVHHAGALTSIYPPHPGFSDL